MALPPLLILLLTLLVRLDRSTAGAWRFNLTNALDETSLHAAVGAGTTDLGDSGPLTFFEVRRPIPVSSPPCATIHLLDHSFGNTISSPPLVVPYTPPSSNNSKCSQRRSWNKVILRWRVTSQGRQFDRISAVWLDGVEILRTSTAEPVKQGIVWEVEKDVTRFSTLFAKPSQDLVVSLGNVIDSTYTGFYNVSLSLDFYTTSTKKSKRKSSTPAAAADVIIPVSMRTSTHGGYWFQFQNDTEFRSVNLVNLPKNIYKAELEICVSFHGSDEFWYTNPTDDYLHANNMTTMPGNGPYREVVAYLDDHLVAEVCPFPVIFTGGINPLMWRPAAAIGAFNLPTYTFDVTPFVGGMVDGGTHSVTLGVTNALSFWLVNANFHLWLDPSGTTTTGRLTRYSAPAAELQYESHYQGPDGTITVSSSRSLAYSGYVVSPSYGNVTTSASYSYDFTNRMEFSHGGNESTVDQRTEWESRVVSGVSSMGVRRVTGSYPLVIYGTTEDTGVNNTVIEVARITHGMVEEVYDSGERVFSRVENRQQSDGKIWVQNGNSVVKGDGELKQQYLFEGTDGCYNRVIQARNTTLLSDHVDTSCDR